MRVGCHSSAELFCFQIHVKISILRSCCNCANHFWSAKRKLRTVGWKTDCRHRWLDATLAKTRRWRAVRACREKHSRKLPSLWIKIFGWHFLDPLMCGVLPYYILTEERHESLMYIRMTRRIKCLIGILATEIIRGAFWMGLWNFLERLPVKYVFVNSPSRHEIDAMTAHNLMLKSAALHVIFLIIYGPPSTIEHKTGT